MPRFAVRMWRSSGTAVLDCPAPKMLQGMVPSFPPCYPGPIGSFFPHMDTNMAVFWSDCPILRRQLRLYPSRHRAMVPYCASLLSFLWEKAYTWWAHISSLKNLKTTVHSSPIQQAAAPLPAFVYTAPSTWSALPTLSPENFHGPSQMFQ